MYDIGMVVSLCLFCSEKAGLCFYAFSVLTEGIFYSRISQYENTLSGDAELSNVEKESYIMAEMIEMMDFTEETENAFEKTLTADEDADCVETESDEQENMPDAEETELDDNRKVPEIDFDRFLPILDFSKVTDEQICDAACNKLLCDSYFGINGFPVIACFLWAYNKAKDDLTFAKQVCIKSKNFNKAFEYLNKTVMSRKSGTSGGVGLDHRQIFAILEEYFALDDAEVARKEAEAELKRKKNAAKKAEKKGADKSKSKAKAPKAAKPKKEEKAETPQISFDDLLGGV